MCRKWARCALSLSMAKKLLAVIGQQVATYEQRLGPIPQPPDDEPDPA